MTDADATPQQPATERPYAFRERLTTVHRTDRRDPAARPEPGELALDERWMIIVDADAPELVRHAARDLQDYLATSMGLDLPLARAAEPGRPVIKLGLDARPGPPAGYLILVEPDRIEISGADPRGTAQGCYFLEDLLNLRTGPYLTPQRTTRQPLFSPRLTHSGYGLDDFPDAYLNQIAHAGMDAVVLFAAGPDRTPDELINRAPDRHSPGRYQRFADLVRRCRRYGLDVYLYAYLHGLRPPHPADPGAAAFYDRTYGALFEACPEAKGLVLVGESVEFPSRDPRTTGRLRLDPAPDGLPDDRPSPGWWPCEDYPDWVAMVRDSCRRHNPDAEIIFWTYNWGWAPEQDRLRLIERLPDDITVQATFEMFEAVEHDGVINACVDYTASSVGPGRYFAGEAAAVQARGMRLSSMVNTGGLTWDIGVINYQPIPQQWDRRHRAVVRARQDWGLTGLMENHHYGWWPSVISDLAKWNYWEPSPDGAITIEALARRDFGPGADRAVAAWQRWSDAFTHYVPTNADQYGPFRIGPSYPLTLFRVPSLSVADHAMFGDLIVTIPYQPDQGGSRPVTANPLRIKGELASLERMAATWQEGRQLFAEAVAAAPPYRRAEADRMANLGDYIGHCVRTTINVKRWWLARSRLLVEDDPDRADQLIDELAELGAAELINAEQAIPCLEADSRLGWEPSMDYLGDADHVRWKLAHLRRVLDRELPDYRASLRLRGRS